MDAFAWLIRRVLNSRDGAGWEGGSLNGSGSAGSNPACQTGVPAPKGFSLPIVPSPLAVGLLSSS